MAYDNIILFFLHISTTVLSYKIKVPKLLLQYSF